MITILRTVMRCAGLWIAIVVSMAVAGAISQCIPQPPIADLGGSSPIDTNGALLIVTVAWCGLLGWLARSVAGRYWTRAGFLFLFVFTVNCALSAVEAAYYLVGTRLVWMHILAIVVNGFIAAALSALAAAAILPAGETAARLRRSNRPAVVACCIYWVAYVLAGYFIAWQSQAVRDFYGEDFQRQISFTGMALLQVARAAVWLGILLASVAMLRGHRLGMALLIGASFAGFMALPLLFPGPMMPWAVRRIHLLEIGVSNFVFGVAAMLWLTAPDSSSGAAAEVVARAETKEDSERFK